MTDEKRVNRRMINKMIGGGILSLLTGGAYVAENEGYTDFVPDEQKNAGGGAGRAGGPQNEGPYFVDRQGFQQAYGDLSDAEKMGLMGETLYQDMFDGEEDDIVGAYFDFNPSEDQTDSSFKYFFVNEIQDYMTTNEEGEEVFDYSALDSEDLKMGSTSWNNVSDSTAETFENYGTRNEEKIPDLLEGGL